MEKTALFLIQTGKLLSYLLPVATDSQMEMKHRSFFDPDWQIVVVNFQFIRDYYFFLNQNKREIERKSNVNFKVVSPLIAAMNSVI